MMIKNRKAIEEMNERHFQIAEITMSKLAESLKDVPREDLEKELSKFSVKDRQEILEKLEQIWNKSKK